jgi:hypothetical protein
MKYYCILLLSFFILNAACQSRSKTEGSKPAKSNCAAKVSFGSPGSGIDLDTYNNVKALIDEKKLHYTERPIGREGETEVCLPLTELKKSEKKEFIQRLKKTVSEGKYTTVSTS